MMLQESMRFLAIVHKADQKMIGTLGLHRCGARYRGRLFCNSGCGKIGYVLSKAYWGQGLMPEAVNAVIDYAFRVLKARRAGLLPFCGERPESAA